MKCISRFYGCLLRLYPRQFRAEFADEMRSIFEQRLRDRPGYWGSATILLSEVRDLPLSVIQEHWRAARQKEVQWAQEGLLMRRNFYSPRFFRWSIITLFALFTLYVCSASLAFIVFDLAHNDLSKAWEWRYDVGNQPGYIGNIFPFTLVGIFLWLISPGLIVMAGGFLLIMLWQQWHGLSRLRWLPIAALLTGSIMFSTMGSPIGYMSALWFYD